MRREFVSRENYVDRHSAWKCVDLTIKVGRRRTRGEERETARSSVRREGICLTYATSNYNGYNGIICLHIVAAKHCCTVKRSTTSVHHAHRDASLCSL